MGTILRRNLKSMGFLIHKVTRHQRPPLRPLAEKWIKQGLQQGLQQGILQKSREAVIDILEVRFKVVPQSIVKTLNEISDPSILKILHRKAVEVKSLEEVGHLIDLMK